MKRTITGTAIGVLTGALLLTGCGTTVAPSAAPAAGGAATATETTPLTPEEALRKAERDHDKKFPDVAQLACASATGTPAANKASQDTKEMTAAAQCRGQAHTARITAALKARAGSKPYTEAEVRSVLDSLGYTPQDGAVYAVSNGVVAFDIFVPGTGPCVTGQVGAATSVSMHGVYPGAGCRGSRGGK
ncbi:hypothetical protein ACWGB8_20445 [Kitasatospora sp. NPDC054939]